ncbi:unnamed protein product [marine sediment metagenome]|uniref:Uncharacterized protein n=1 Tax=marine sediment metagenome TaxID=412755 RepID=X1BUW8_9ZZZZ
MKPHNKIDLIFSVNGKTVAIQNISGWTVQRIIGFLRIQNRFFPDRDYRIKRKEEANNFIPLSETAERVEGRKP